MCFETDRHPGRATGTIILSVMMGRHSHSSFHTMTYNHTIYRLVHGQESVLSLRKLNGARNTPRISGAIRATSLPYGSMAAV